MAAYNLLSQHPKNAGIFGKVMDRVEERPTQGNHKTCMGLYSYDALLDVMEGMEWKTVSIRGKFASQSSSPMHLSFRGLDFCVHRKTETSNFRAFESTQGSTSFLEAMLNQERSQFDQKTSCLIYWTDAYLYLFWTCNFPLLLMARD